MITRRLLIALLWGLLVLLVAFAVLMAFFALVSALGDAVAARAVFWVANGCLILLVVDLVLLIAALAWRTIESESDGEQEL